VLLAFAKIFSYLRASESLSKMTILLTNVFEDVKVFNLIFLTLAALLMAMFLFSGSPIYSEEDFPENVPFGLASAIQALRNSIGDIGTPSYDAWKDKEGGLVMVIWISFQFVMGTYMQNIIMLNFLVAQVSQSYDNVMGMEEVYMIRNMADCNVESTIFLDAFAWGSKGGVTQSVYITLQQLTDSMAGFN
jgi:hypothetical protein